MSQELVKYRCTYDRHGHATMEVDNELGTWLKAEDVARVFGEVEETMDVLINLIPDIGKLSKVQHVMRLLAGLDRQKETEAPGIEWSEDMPNGY